MLRKRFALLEKIVTLVITYCFFVNYGLAEPGPTISQLMKEPISLWDWGMFRIEEAGERASKTIMRVHNLETLTLS